ncbi:MAG TPA: DUF192 domain-containing protein [Myxococcota bacterium]|nr:DUF192 domain-containing protein [Myxococcota bacterium]
MKTVCVRNRTRQSVLAEQAAHATGFFERARGLLGRPEPAAGEGFVLEPCNSVHMFFMRYALDVVFADADAHVTGCVEELRPWRLSKVHWGSRYAIELPVGTIAATSTQPGDVLEIG